MDGVYYLCMLVGIVWLCLWSASEDGGRRPKIWWPFDRRDEPTPPERPLPPWKRRG